MMDGMVTYAFGNISSNVTSVRTVFAISKNVFDKLFSKPGIISSTNSCEFSLITALPISPNVRSPLNRFSKWNRALPIDVFINN